MPAVRQVIEIITVMKDRLSGNTRKMHERVQTLSNGITESRTQVMKWNKGVRVAGTTITKTTKGMARFKFEWLGVMFLGMAINRLFGVYIKQTLQMLGVTDLFTEAIKYSIYTALSPFLDQVYSLLLAFWGFPESLQAAIGWIFILGTFFGTLLMITGMLALGINSLAMVVANFSGGTVTAAAATKSLIAGLGIFAALAVSIGITIYGIIHIWRNWREIIERASNSVTRAGMAIYKVFGIVGLAIFIFKAWDKILEKIRINIDKVKSSIERLGFSASKVINIIKGYLALSARIATGIISPFGFAGRFLPKAQFGGEVARTGAAIIHRGERIIPAGKELNLNITYNIEIADKAELESMLRRHDTELVEEVKRQIAI